MTTRKKKIPSIPIYFQILLGMIVGIIIGVIALQVNGEQFVQSWIYPWGRLFIRLLQLIAVPLILVTLIKGLIGLKDMSTFSRVGSRTVLLYLMTTVFAILLGLSMGLLVKPGKLVNKEAVEHIREKYQNVAVEKELAAEKQQEKGPLAFIDDIVPNNVFAAATDNSKMLQVIFFAVLFGIAALSVMSEKIKPLIHLLDSLNDIILRMVDYIIRCAPYGVVALMAGLITDFNGDLSVFSALAVYALVVVISLFIIILIFYPLLIHFFTKTSIKKFLKAIYPVQLLAFTTSSSSAVLPVSMEAVEKELGVSPEVTSFVMPIGATVNMDGTSCYQAIAVLFIAQVLGIELSISQLLIIIGMSVISSIGTPGIPGGSFVILTMVLTSVGIPAEGLALIMGVDRPLDMVRTAVNVTGDAVVASIVDTKIS